MDDPTSNDDPSRLQVIPIQRIHRLIRPLRTKVGKLIEAVEEDIRWRKGCHGVNEARNDRGAGEGEGGSKSLGMGRTNLGGNGTGVGNGSSPLKLRSPPQPSQKVKTTYTKRNRTRTKYPTGPVQTSTNGSPVKGKGKLRLDPLSNLTELTKLDVVECPFVYANDDIAARANGVLSAFGHVLGSCRDHFLQGRGAGSDRPGLGNGMSSERTPRRPYSLKSPAVSTQSPADLSSALVPTSSPQPSTSTSTSAPTSNAFRLPTLLELSSKVIGLLIEGSLSSFEQGDAGGANDQGVKRDLEDAEKVVEEVEGWYNALPGYCRGFTFSTHALSIVLDQIPKIPYPLLDSLLEKCIRAGAFAEVRLVLKSILMQFSMNHPFSSTSKTSSSSMTSCQNHTLSNYLPRLRSLLSQIFPPSPSAPTNADRSDAFILQTVIELLSSPRNSNINGSPTRKFDPFFVLSEEGLGMFLIEQTKFARALEVLGEVFKRVSTEGRQERARDGGERLARMRVLVDVLQRWIPIVFGNLSHSSSCPGQARDGSGGRQMRERKACHEHLRILRELARPGTEAGFGFRDGDWDVDEAQDVMTTFNSLMVAVNLMALEVLLAGHGEDGESKEEMGRCRKEIARLIMFEFPTGFSDGEGFGEGLGGEKRPFDLSAGLSSRYPNAPTKGRAYDPSIVVQCFSAPSLQQGTTGVRAGFSPSPPLILRLSNLLRAHLDRPERPNEDAGEWEEGLLILEESLLNEALRPSSYRYDFSLREEEYGIGGGGGGTTWSEGRNRIVERSEEVERMLLVRGGARIKPGGDLESRRGQVGTGGGGEVGEWRWEEMVQSWVMCSSPVRAEMKVEVEGRSHAESGPSRRSRPNRRRDGSRSFAVADGPASAVAAAADMKIVEEEDSLLVRTRSRSRLCGASNEAETFLGNGFSDSGYGGSPSLSPPSTSTSVSASTSMETEPGYLPPSFEGEVEHSVDLGRSSMSGVSNRARGERKRMWRQSVEGRDGTSKGEIVDYVGTGRSRSAPSKKRRPNPGSGAVHGRPSEDQHSKEEGPEGSSSHLRKGVLYGPSSASGNSHPVREKEGLSGSRERVKGSLRTNRKDRDHILEVVIPIRDDLSRRRIRPRPLADSARPEISKFGYLHQTAISDNINSASVLTSAAPTTREAMSSKRQCPVKQEGEGGCGGVDDDSVDELDFLTPLAVSPRKAKTEKSEMGRKKIRLCESTRRQKSRRLMSLDRDGGSDDYDELGL